MRAANMMSLYATRNLNGPSFSFSILLQLGFPEIEIHVMFLCIAVQNERSFVNTKTLNAAFPENVETGSNLIGRVGSRKN